MGIISRTGEKIGNILRGGSKYDPTTGRTTGQAPTDISKIPEGQAPPSGKVEVGRDTSGRIVYVNASTYSGGTSGSGGGGASDSVGGEIPQTRTEQINELVEDIKSKAETENVSFDVAKARYFSDYARGVRGYGKTKGIDVGTDVGAMRASGGYIEEQKKRGTKIIYNKPVVPFNYNPFAKISDESVGSILIGSYEKANLFLRKKVTEPTIGKFFNVFRYEPEKTDLGIATEWFESIGVPSPIAKSGEFLAGAGLDILQDIRIKPAKQIGLAGVGGLAGFAVSGTIASAGLISPSFKIATKIGTTLAGVGLTGYYGAKIYEEVKLSPNYGTKGGVVGIAAKDVTLFGFGFGRGGKAFQQVGGWWRTKGRTEVLAKDLIPTEVLSGKKTFPTALGRQHYKLFVSGKAGKIIGETSGGFHASPEKFWNGGEIIPIKGSSELPGLYTAHVISPHFAKISDGGTEYKLFGLIEGGLPGVAYLKPKGFRTAEWIKVGKKRYKWVTPVKQGFADIPKMKPEVEAIFRPGSGVYSFESGKYYTKIKGVRVPIDVFGYNKEGIGLGNIKNIGGIKVRGGGSSYSSIQKYSLLTSESIGLGMGISSYKRNSSKKRSDTIYKPGYKPRYEPGYESSYKPLSHKTIGYSVISSGGKKSYYDSSQFKLGGIIPSNKKKQIILPKLKIFSKMKKIKVNRNFFYQPGVYALGTGLKSYKIPKMAITGITTRPVITRKIKRL